MLLHGVDCLGDVFRADVEFGQQSRDHAGFSVHEPEADFRSASLSVSTQLNFMASAYNGGNRFLDEALETGAVKNVDYVHQFEGYLRKADKLYCRTGQFRCPAAS